MQSIVNTVFLFFHFHFRRSTYVKNSYTTCHLSQTFLQFFFIVIGSSVFDLSLDLTDTSLDSCFIACTVHNDRSIFVYSDLFGSTQHIHCSTFQFQTFFLQR